MRILSFVLVFLEFTLKVASLRITENGVVCFSCLDINANTTDCRDAGGLLDIRRSLEQMSFDERLILLQRGKYGMQLCGIYQPFCLIQDVYDSSNTDRSRFIRGCSDGQHYSFQYSDGSYFTMNKTGLGKPLPSPNNQSVCQMSLLDKSQVCLRLCSTDFCNGPQYPLTKEDDNADAAGCGNSDFVLTVMVLMLNALLIKD